MIAVSWFIALFEYILQVPANRIGHGTFSAAQLKTIQEVITLIVFSGFSVLYLKESLNWNHAIGFALIGDRVKILSGARIGEADHVVDRRLARHGDGAGGHVGNRAPRVVRGRDAGLPAADQHAQADLDPLGAVGMFQHAAAHVDAGGLATGRQGVGPVGACPPGRIDQRFGQRLQIHG